MNKFFFFIFSLILLSTTLHAQIVPPVSGTQKSFEVAFDGLLKGDGGLAEEWDIEIGKHIKTHPTNFLRALVKYRSKVKRLDALVGNFGYELVDNFEGQKKEAKARLEALIRAKQRSSDPQLKKLADECIGQLKNHPVMRM